MPRPASKNPKIRETDAEKRHLFHTTKLLQQAVKKAKQFEVRKTSRRLKQALERESTVTSAENLQSVTVEGAPCKPKQKGRLESERIQDQLKALKAVGADLVMNKALVSAGVPDVRSTDVTPATEAAPVTPLDVNVGGAKGAVCQEGADAKDRVAGVGEDKLEWAVERILRATCVQNVLARLKPKDEIALSRAGVAGGESLPSEKSEPRSKMNGAENKKQNRAILRTDNKDKLEEEVSAGRGQDVVIGEAGAEAQDAVIAARGIANILKIAKVRTRGKRKQEIQSKARSEGDGIEGHEDEDEHKGSTDDDEGQEIGMGSVSSMSGDEALDLSESDGDYEVEWTGRGAVMGSAEMLGGSAEGNKSQKVAPKKKPKKRMGQRERQRIAELKYGTRAKHLAKAAPVQGGQAVSRQVPAGVKGFKSLLSANTKQTRLNAGRGRGRGSSLGREIDSAGRGGPPFVGRGGGSFKQHIKGVPAGSTDEASSLHPSWAAKKAQQAQPMILPAAGKKIKFDNDSD